MFWNRVCEDGTSWTENLIPSYLFQAKAASPIPLAVKEVLSTAKGTTFYVLTVAGEHGIPAEEDATTGGDPAVDSAFLTDEVPVDDGKPDYIVSVDVPDRFILQIKKG